MKKPLLIAKYGMSGHIPAIRVSLRVQPSKGDWRGGVSKRLANKVNLQKAYMFRRDGLDKVKTGYPQETRDNPFVLLRRICEIWHSNPVQTIFYSSKTMQKENLEQEGMCHCIKAPWIAYILTSTYLKETTWQWHTEDFHKNYFVLQSFIGK